MIAALPEEAPYQLPFNTAGSDEWYFEGLSLFHNGKEHEFPNHTSLNDLTTRQKVGLQISMTNELNLYIDGTLQEINGSDYKLPTKKPLYGAVSVCYNCFKIKSEFLSGEYVYNSTHRGFINVLAVYIAYDDVIRFEKQ